VTVTSPPKETRDFDGREYVLEEAIIADYGLVRAWEGDRHGNLVYRDSRGTSTRWPRCAAGSRSPRSRNSSGPET
jgi:acyl CoA:acetate/3-ketoacid CoA transferase alpha subunit